MRENRVDKTGYQKVEKCKTLANETCERQNMVRNPNTKSRLDKIAAKSRLPNKQRTFLEIAKENYQKTQVSKTNQKRVTNGYKPQKKTKRIQQ